MGFFEFIRIQWVFSFSVREASDVASSPRGISSSRLMTISEAGKLLFTAFPAQRGQEDRQHSRTGWAAFRLAECSFCSH